MFTGLIEEIGTVESVLKGQKSSAITIKAHKILTDIHIGDSIAVNGVCLTAANVTDTTFTADVMSETLQRSSLSDIKQGQLVNLERAMPADGRFGGHIVCGHIDGVGTITSKIKNGNSVLITIAAPANILKYIVEKGSIAIDGISLTVTFVNDLCFKVSIIPHTATETTLLNKKNGDNVNLECDILGKYIEKFLLVNNKGRKIDMDFLTKHGF